MKRTNYFTGLLLAGTMLITLMGCGQGASKSEEGTAVPQKSSESLGKVVYGIHQGGSANNAGFVIDQLDLDSTYNFEGEMIVSNGPNVYAAVSSGEMNVGFLGNGMAWHYFEKDAKLSILTIDSLSDDDKLFMRDGMGFKGNLEDDFDALYEMLPGKTLALDLTTTPGTFLKSLIGEINKDRSDPVWFNDVEGAYPTQGKPENKINILSTTNSNITAAMQDTDIDGCIAFGNVSKTILDDTVFTSIASPFSHLQDKITPNTWCVNKEWAEKNPELCQAFTNALVDAMDYRADENNWEDLIQRAMKFDQLNHEDYIFPSRYLSRAELNEYHSTPDSEGYHYMEQIRNSHIGSNGLTDENMKTVEEAFLGQFVIEGSKIVK